MYPLYPLFSYPGYLLMVFYSLPCQTALKIVDCCAFRRMDSAIHTLFLKLLQELLLKSLQLFFSR